MNASFAGTASWVMKQAMSPEDLLSARSLVRPWSKSRRSITSTDTSRYEEAIPTVPSSEDESTTRISLGTRLCPRSASMSAPISPSALSVGIIRLTVSLTFPTSSYQTWHQKCM